MFTGIAPVAISAGGGHRLRAFCAYQQQNHVPLPLMIPLGVKMRTVIPKDMSERSLSQEDHFRQTLLFHRTIPPLQMRVAVGTTRRRTRTAQDRISLSQ